MYNKLARWLWRFFYIKWMALEQQQKLDPAVLKSIYSFYPVENTWHFQTMESERHPSQYTYNFVQTP